MGGAAQAVRAPHTGSEEPPQNGGPAAPAQPKPLAPDVRHLLDAVGNLTPVKQITVYENLPLPELEVGNGVTITAKSKKERRRFTRPIDADVLEWLGSLRPGDVFYDIGANCGSLTLAAGGMHGSEIQAVAIEPGYANFESLVRNLSHNDMLGFVVPLQVALMDRTKLEPINYYKSTGAGTSFHAVGEAVDQENNPFDPVETQIVPAFKLDDLIEVLGLPAPTHVKVDVDGVEGPLLRGAARTLASGVIQELLVEIVDHDRSGTRLEAVTAMMAEHGYELAETSRHHEGDEQSFVADHLFRRTGEPRPAAPAAAAAEAPVSAPVAAPAAPEAAHGSPEHLIAKHERAAQRSLAKLEAATEKLKHEREASAEKLGQLRGQYDELRRSYYLSGVGKKVDLRELDGFGPLAAMVIADGRTGMNYDRLYTLWQAVAEAPADAPVIEIGSYLGGSARFISEALKARGTTPPLYVCDTFAGHADTSESIDTSHHESGKFEDTSAEGVEAYLQGYPALHMVVGDIAQTSATLPDGEYGLVHLDVDVYPTTLFGLRHFAPRLAPRALMVLDDYATTTCPGVKQAADEFLAEAPEFRLWHLLSGQALLWRH